MIHRLEKMRFIRMKKLLRLSTSPAAQKALALNLRLTLLSGLALSVFPLLLSAQSVTFSGSATGVAFPNANVCPSGTARPAPCSQTLTLTYNVTASGTLGTPQVLTTGAPNLDYTLASASTCSGAVTAGTTCTVKATLTPRYAGERKGAVQIVDGSGNVLATTLIHGIGVAPQIAFDPGVTTSLNAGIEDVSDLAVDDLDNVYAADAEDDWVLEFPADGANSIFVGTGLSFPTAVALDGAGNVFITNLDGDFPSTGFVVAASPDGSQVTVPFTGLSEPLAIAVDGSGSVFVANYNNSTHANSVVELPAGGGDQITLPFTGLGYVYSVTVDSLGDVFASGGVSVTGQPLVLELPADGSGQKSLPLDGGTLAVDAAGDIFGADFGIVQLPAGATAPIQISQTAGDLDAVAVSAAGDVFANLQSSTSYPLLVIHRSQPPPLNFPETTIGTTSTLAAQIQNIGNATLSLSSLSVSGNFAQVPGSGTPVDCTASSSLAPGARCNLSIQFAPETDSPLTGAVTLSDNALNSDHATQIIPLSGTGLKGVAGGITVGATSVQFGVIPFGTTEVRFLPVNNVSVQGTVTIGTAINGVSYEISTTTQNDCLAGISEGQTCYLPVEFAPAWPGRHGESLTLTPTGGSAPITVPLFGTASDVTPNVKTLQFGTIPFGTSKVLLLTITNNEAPDTVTIGTAVSGASYKILTTAQNTCTAGIAAGQSCTLPVEFSPTSVGRHGEFLTLTPSAGSLPSTVNLYGDGSAAP
jgi:hypothetical protein